MDTRKLPFTKFHGIELATITPDCECPRTPPRLTERPVHINDFNATILKCMGINHERFTFPFQGLDQRFTGVGPASPVEEILA